MWMKIIFWCCINGMEGNLLLNVNRALDPGVVSLFSCCVEVWHYPNLWTSSASALWLGKTIFPFLKNTSTLRTSEGKISLVSGIIALQGKPKPLVSQCAVQEISRVLAVIGSFWYICKWQAMKQFIHLKEKSYHTLKTWQRESKITSNSQGKRTRGRKVQYGPLLLGAK